MAQIEKEQKNLAAETKDLESQIYQLEREMQDMEDGDVLMDAVTNELSMNVVEFNSYFNSAKKAEIIKQNDEAEAEAEAEKARLAQEEQKRKEE